MAWTDCLLNPVSCTVSTVGDAAANSAWESFLRWSARGLSDFSATVFNVFSSSTAPRFDQKWWKDNLDLMVTVSLPILVVLFVLQCLSAVVRREPARLGRALSGALIGTAGVPLAIGIVASCGRVVDEISAAVLGTDLTADGFRRMTDITPVLTAASSGGFLLLAVLLALLSLFALYFVMLLREVALVAFVVFAPIAMASWTWSATRHWMRRWVEVVGALLFSKVAMAVVFALGLSATGASGQGNGSNLGTFLAGVLLVAMAAFAPLATFSFIHWAGDQGSAATHALQQGTAGATAAREQVDQAQQWRADHFGASDDASTPPVGKGYEDSPNGDETDVSVSGSSPDQYDEGAVHGSESTAGSPAPPQSSADPGAPASNAVAVATSQVTLDGGPETGQRPDLGSNDSGGPGSPNRGE